ncbi:serine/threonine-protein kinase PknK [Vitiosangium sp. GDMCC 1.1324]|uniref:serine/threonine-protein kinase n=1 Tax=Vitiosangium sp. (strain GDMCC 1.1324) TaxID=2138576 RepID=UPI000D39A245|nr:serine/threonine-protein kinase [Vitiosangium sp. GDMCC 1.1324]PTL79385.1 serine/threonine-protein kinase PknK [Vitiosangium sp. GDMCC 1.1324]
MASDSTFTSPTSPQSGGGSAPPPLPQGGTVLAGRFRIEELAGRGGMGSVFRTTDLQTGQTVALKLLHTVSYPEVTHRFNREAVLLSELRHPAIVSYVAHGTSEEGQPFLVMEWLEGEDLSHRQIRQPLGLTEALTLVRRVAEGLAIAHRQGIVHRDIKPSNLFLRGGNPENVVVLDFGLARYTLPTLGGVTRTDMVLGTPGYMAPEQASGQSEIPPCADIFSLGCVLYECLTGQPPFKAPHFSAALAKILFAEAPPLNALRPGLPSGLQGLMDGMLAKDTRRRLPDATHLLEALSALDSLPEMSPPRAVGGLRPTSLFDAERQLVSVLLVSLPARPADEQEEQRKKGLALRDSMRAALAPFGARVERLADGTLVATLTPDRGTATDQAALAARCALTLKDRWPEAAVVLATGLGVIDEHLPMGEAMDKAGRLLRQLEQAPIRAVVMLDEVTTGLLGPGFQLYRSNTDVFLLRAEQFSADTSRPLLGKPTPCVGREQELALLEFTLSSCYEESSARALLVTAPPGTGKSRLRHEFLRRIERRDQPVLVLLGRGEPMSAGASYGLLGQALRMLCGVVEGEDAESHRARLTQRLSKHLPPAEAKETVEFLGELCALPFPDDTNPRLRAARGDPRLMSAQVSRAVVSFLKAECAHHPVLLVLEDLHWSDALTIKLVDELLRELAEQPLLVLALARPEVKTLFPSLWSRRLQEVPLSGLSRKASARLVREVLGSQVPDNIVQKAVEQSDGNALFLEELIRMLAEGRGEVVPETVLAVLQARLMRMEPGVRQTLLAASIFGRTFWSGGVKELLVWQGSGEKLEEHLRRLVEQEVIEPQADSRFPAEAQYRFRHALVRDAAYGLVPENHRPMGHRLAGDWLERMGEPEPLVLATHYQRGELLVRAVHLYIQASERLFERNDLPGTLQCVDSALACGARDEDLVRLRALQAVAAFWGDDLARALELGGPVLDELGPGSRLWCWVVGGLVVADVYSGQQPGQSARLSQLLLSTTPQPEAVSAYYWAVACLGLAHVLSGARWEAQAVIERLWEMVADGMNPGWARYIQAFFHFRFEAKPWQAFLQAEQGMRDFRELGLERDALILQTISGMALAALGDVPGAVERMRDVLIVSQQWGAHLANGAAQNFLCQVMADSPDLEHRREAHAQAREWVVGAENGYAYRQGTVHAVLAKVMTDSGEPREAEPYARKACELLAMHQTELIHARTYLSATLLAQGRAAEARQEAEVGVRQLEQMGNAGVYAVAMHLVLAEACFAQGDVRAGELALREALRCVRDRANDITDPSLQERFLRQVPENARTLELARQRWGGSVE